MVLITKSFLVKVLMGVQKMLYLSCYISYKVKANMNDEEAKIFLCRYPFFSLSFSLQWCLYAVLRIFSGS